MSAVFYDAFISYSTQDIDFVTALRLALEFNGRRVWQDVKELELTAEWWDQIKQGVFSSDNFLFVVSPRSIASPICHLELEYARQRNKRVIFIRHEAVAKEASIPAMVERMLTEDYLKILTTGRDMVALAEANWQAYEAEQSIQITSKDELLSKVSRLVEAFDKDLLYIRQGNILLGRAKEWEDSGHSAGFLLVGTALQAAETWRQAGKIPPPTPLHFAYIDSSRQAERRRRRVAWGVQISITGLALALIMGALLATAIVGQTQQQVTAGGATLISIATEVQSAENFADSIRLAARAQDVYTNSRNPSFGLALALEASYLDNPPQTERILSELGYQPGTRRHFAGHTNAVLSVAFSPDGSQLLSGSGDDTLILWDTASGAELRRFGGHSGAVTSVAFSPDGSQLLSGSGDDTLILWEAASGAELRRFEGHTGAVTSVMFSPDGQRLLSGSDDGTLILWEAASGEMLRRFEGHTNEVTSVAFSPDGQLLLSGSDDGTLILWHNDSLEQLQAWIQANRYIPALTCSDRITYSLPLACVNEILPPSPTLAPTQTPFPLLIVPQQTFTPS